MRDSTWIAARGPSIDNTASHSNTKSATNIDYPPRSNPVQLSPASSSEAKQDNLPSVSSHTEENHHSSHSNASMNPVSSLRPPVTPAPSATRSLSPATYHSLIGARNSSPPPNQTLQDVNESESEERSTLHHGAIPSLIPDRNSTLSAPPDLEISSRSLFAFKADYSGIFSDIRRDEHYESFYNNFPEKDKLPPPLDASATSPLAISRSRLRRDDSDASIEELIFRGSRRLRPDSSQNLEELGRIETSAEVARSGVDIDSGVSTAAPAGLKQGGSRHSFSAPKPIFPQSRQSHSYGQKDVHTSTESLSSFSRDREYKSPQPRRDSQGQHEHTRRQQEAPYMAAYATATAAAAAQFASPMPHGAPLQDYHSPIGAAPASTPGGMDHSSEDPSWHLSRLALEDREPHTPDALSRNQQGTHFASPTPVPSYPLAPSHPAFAAAAAAVGQYGMGSEFEGTPPWDAVSSPMGTEVPARVQPRYRNPRPSYRRGGPYPSPAGRGSGGNFHYSPVSGAGINGNSFPLNSGNGYMDDLNAQAAAAAAAAAAAVYSGGRANVYGIRQNKPMNRNGGSSHGLNGTNKGVHRASDIDFENRFSSFTDIIGRAEELARDQHGCRFLQTKLEEGNTDYLRTIYDECFEKFVDLMTDPFGNYLCQKLFEFCNDDQRLALVRKCAASIPSVSSNMHGTRAVQRMVECLSTPEQVRAVCDALAPAAVKLMKDINGNHVIQRCLQKMDHTNNQFVYDTVVNNCYELASHRNGCCVMQRCMDYASPAQKNQLATQIITDALPLVQNAFGNYVVQYVLDMNDPTYTGRIIKRLQGHLTDLSMQKFSSNVIEKCLQQAERVTKSELIAELILDPESIKRLLHDAYGNYVIQRTLQITEGPELELICESIRPHLNSLKQTPYGKRIQSRILKRMPRSLSQFA